MYKLIVIMLALAMCGCKQSTQIGDEVDIAMNEIDDVAQKYINKNNTKIGELKTLLDYINS